MLLYIISDVIYYPCWLLNLILKNIPVCNMILSYQSKLATRPGSYRVILLEVIRPRSKRKKQHRVISIHPPKPLFRRVSLKLEGYLTITYATLSKKAATVRLRIIFCAVKTRQRFQSRSYSIFKANFCLCICIRFEKGAR